MKTYFIPAINKGQETEYFNDQFKDTSKLKENVPWFSTREEAEEALENAKKVGEEKGWTATYSVEEIQVAEIEKLNELQAKVNSALTAEASGRQIVADCCKELYKTIEEDVHNADADWMLRGMYEDLCQGNFAEPFMCEQKKVAFATVKKIYEDNILPRL